MAACKTDIRARAHALVLATDDSEEQRGIAALAAPLLAGSSNMVFDDDINQTAVALFEASESPGFRRGITLLAWAIARNALPIEPRADNSRITVQSLQQQIDALTTALLPGARLAGPVVLFDQRGKVLP